MRALITGTGNMGRAIRAALEERGDSVVGFVGRRTLELDRPLPAVNSGEVDVCFEFSHASSLLRHVDFALASGCRRLVIGTTGWGADPTLTAALERRLEAHAARAVIGASFSVGVVLFMDLAVAAASLFGRFADYDPYVFEWHRRTKADRPSGTALAIANRLLPELPGKHRARLADGPGAPDADTLEVVSLRAGASPGMHVVGFDAPGESIELRMTARDRGAYVSGALLAADSLLAQSPPRPGISAFEDLVHALGRGRADRPESAFAAA